MDRTWIERIPRLDIIKQLSRYGAVGLLCSAVYSLAYMGLAAPLPDGWEVAAVPPAFCLGLAIGFFLHRDWSFQGRTAPRRRMSQPFRFVTIQMLGLTLNCLFTAIVTIGLRLPDWMALIPCLTLTPMTTFLFHRHWVFGGGF